MKLDISGFEAVTQQLEDLERHAEGMFKKALYEGAAIMADEVKDGLQGIPIDQNPDGSPKYGTPKHKLHGITQTEKEDLINSMGIAKFKKDNGAFSTSIGFSGRSRTTSEKQPAGISNQTIMRRVESGTSWMEKHPVIRPALNRAKKKVKAAMEAAVDESIKKEN